MLFKYDPSLEKNIPSRLSLIYNFMILDSAASAYKSVHLSLRVEGLWIRIG